MELFIFATFQLLIIQLYIIWKLHNKNKWWEETYKKTKDAHADIVNRHIFGKDEGK